MIDPDARERQALQTAMKFMGELLAEIGGTTRFNELSAEQARAATAQLFRGVGAMLAGTDHSAMALLNMISMQPMDAAAVRKLVGDAYCAVSGKLADVQSKLSG
jgi:hypothetical protein